MARNSEQAPLAQSPEELRAKFQPETILQTEKIDIVAGNGNLELSRKIAWLLAKDLHQPITIFADGEKKHNSPDGNFRKKGVFIIQSFQPSPDERLMETFMMIDAVRRGSAEDIALVLPYLGYTRQDHKDDARVPISATIPPKMFQELGVDRMLSMELHSPAQQGYFDKPWDIVDSNFVTVPEILSRNFENPIIAAADAGGKKRAKAFSESMGLGDNVVQATKDRDVSKTNVSRAEGFDGNVYGKDVIIVEDIIDTSGTIIGVAKLFHADGARSIRVVAPYGLFSTDANGIRAIDKIEASPIDEIITTNAVEAKPDAIQSKKITYVDIAPMLAEAMLCIHTGESISKRLILPKPRSNNH